KATYILQELPTFKVFKAKEQPTGLMVDFSTKAILADFEGGKLRPSIGNRNVDDDAGTEMLILLEDGRVTVKNSLKDGANKEREKREEGWVSWVRKVAEMTLKLGAPTDPNGSSGGSGFGRNPGGSGN
ncbi:MAG: hypothetical protein ACRCZF_14750, partial [Gemmataceae bacterium]